MNYVSQIIDLLASLFVLALGFFFISMVLDSIPPLPFFWRFQSIYVEDSAKFLGIVSWCIYYCVFCFETVRKTQLISSPGTNPRSLGDAASAQPIAHDTVKRAALP